MQDLTHYASVEAQEVLDKARKATSDPQVMVGFMITTGLLAVASAIQDTRTDHPLFGETGISDMALALGRLADAVEKIGED